MEALAVSEINGAARPLLHLLRHVTGLEIGYVCSAPRGAEPQRVLFAANDRHFEIDEGSPFHWPDEATRERSGIRAFHCVPIQVGESKLGTLCVAGREPTILSESQLEGMRLIAAAFEHLIVAERSLSLAEDRATQAEESVVRAREETVRHAADSLQMQRLAHTDVLTGLPNRRGFVTRWEDQVARSARRGTPLGLMLIDADRFKQVNDTMGHGMGDAVLRGIGTALLLARRSTDLIARLGGDEFALVTTDASEDQMRQLAEAIREGFAVIAKELGAECTLSIGFVSSASCRRESMLAMADEALYLSKAAGGNSVETIEFEQS